LSDQNPLELAPTGMVGWVDEAGGEPLAVAGPGELRVRVVFSAGRVVVIAVGHEDDQAVALLERLQLRPELLRRMLCG
jgi:hypothetical protein